jgi:UDP-glucuronate 4-epimerase
MNILVTGGAGLIGMPLRQALRARGHDVTAIDVTNYGRSDADLTLMSFNNVEALKALFAARRIEAVAHCGALSGPMMARDDPMKMVEINIDGTARLLEEARLGRIARFVFCSSISVYGDVGEAPITETTPLAPTSVYGASKVAGEQLIRGFSAQFGVDGVSLRIARVYGPYRRGNCHIASTIRDAARGAVTEIPCDPAFRYHYVYVDDVVDAIIAALGADALTYREYNVGSGEVTVMPELAALAEETIPGAKVRLVPGGDDVPDVQTTFDISRIDADLGWRPRFDLKRGIASQRAHPASASSATDHG